MAYNAQRIILHGNQTETHADAQRASRKEQREQKLIFPNVIRMLTISGLSKHKGDTMLHLLITWKFSDSTLLFGFQKAEKLRNFPFPSEEEPFLQNHNKRHCSAMSRVSCLTGFYFAKSVRLFPLVCDFRHRAFPQKA